MRFANLITTSTIIFIGTSLFAQNKKIDELEALFDQKRFGTVVRKAERMLLSADYQNNSIVHYFSCLSKFELGRIKQTPKRFRQFNTQRTIRDLLDFPVSNNLALCNYYSYSNNFRLLAAQQVIELSQIQDNQSSIELLLGLNRYFGTADSLQNMNFSIDSEANPLTTENQHNYNSSDLENANSVNPTRSKIIKTAKNLKGITYVYGGTTVKGFDCSGFSQFVFNKNQIRIPRTASEQAKSVKKIKLKKAQQGDLVFFGPNNIKITHVGIVISKEGEPLAMLHSSSSRGVMKTVIKEDPYWRARILFAGQVIN